MDKDIMKSLFLAAGCHREACDHPAQHLEAEPKKFRNCGEQAQYPAFVKLPIWDRQWNFKAHDRRSWAGD